MFGRIVGAFGAKFHESVNVGVDAAAAYLVSARLGEICLPETGQDRSHHHHGASQLCAAAHKIRAAYVEFVDVPGSEPVLSLGKALHNDTHALKQGDEVLDIQYLGDIGYRYRFGCKQGGAYHLQGLVLGTLRLDGPAQTASALYDE